MWFFLLVGLWGILRLDVFVSFLGGFFFWDARDFFFLFFYLSFVRGGLGVLDHGAVLQVCFFFSVTLCFTVGHTGLCTFYVLMGLYIAAR